MSKKHRLLPLILSILLFTTLTTLHATPKPSTQNLKINNTLIELDTPLIQENNTLYAPLRDLLKPLNATLKRQRKDNRLILKLKKDKLTCILAPYSKELHINTEPTFLSQPTRYYENRLYVPIPDFFNAIHYTQTGNPLHFSKSKSRPKPQSISAANNHDTLLSSSGDEAVTFFEDMRLPKLKAKKAMFLSFGNGIYDLTNTYIYENNILFIKLLPIFKKEGFKLSDTPETLTLKNRHKAYTFSKKNNAVTITQDGQKTQTQLQHPLIQKKGHWYFPFKSTIAAMDLSISFNKKKNRLVILNKLKTMHVVKKKDKKIAIQVLSAYPLDLPEISPLYADKGYILTLPYTRNHIAKTLHKDVGFIRKIDSQNEGHSQSQIRIHTLPNAPYPNIKKTSYGLEITFHSTVTDIRQTGNGLVEIVGSSPLKHKVSTHKNPHRLIIDIPNTISKLPQVIRSQNPAHYKKIRTSQYQENPPITRIVIDMEKGSKLKSVGKKNNTLTLNFPKSTHKIAKSTPKTKKTYKAKKKSKKRKKGRGLRGKIIAIDPGHGGRDPGAIGINRSYEKTYTLDIANRLKEKLESAGAHVVMSRRYDKNTHLSSRTRIANRNRADILISIHINSFFNGKAHGTETYYYKTKDKALARSLQNEMVKDLKLKNNGIKRAKLYVLNHSKMPAALVEPAFMTNKKEFKKLKNKRFREKIADSLYRGVKNYFKR